MATKQQQGWFYENLGKGHINYGRDNTNKGFVTKYKVSFQTLDGQIQEMTKFVEEIIRKRELPSQLILIETSKISLTSDTIFIVKSNEVYDETMAKRMFMGISSIGEELEKKYFPANASLRKVA